MLTSPVLTSLLQEAHAKSKAAMDRAKHLNAENRERRRLQEAQQAKVADEMRRKKEQAEAEVTAAHLRTEEQHKRYAEHVKQEQLRKEQLRAEQERREQARVVKEWEVESRQKAPKFDAWNNSTDAMQDAKPAPRSWCLLHTHVCAL